MHRTEGTNHIGNKFAAGPPPSTVTPEWLNSIQEEICHVIEGAGIKLESQQSETTFTQLFLAIQSLLSGYDLIINTQANFSNAIERIGANDYQFKDDYASIFVKNVTSGFSVSGMLSDGDTWGNIKTNQCTHLEFENGASFNFGDAPGSIIVNTEGALLRNVHVKGIGSVAAAVTESFYLAALHVTYDNCKCSSRYSNAAIPGMVGFKGSTTASHNYTSKYIGCSVYSLSGNLVIYGFNTCYNLTNCLVYDCSSTYDSMRGFSSCNNLVSCMAYSLSSTEANVYGFDSCTNLSSCSIKISTSSGPSAIIVGFITCKYLSSCTSTDLTSTEEDAYGFYTCTCLSSCYATDITAGAGAGDYGYGFINCTYISSCYTTAIAGNTNNGFGSCTYGAALGTDEAANSLNDWIDTVDAGIANKVSTPSVWT